MTMKKGYREEAKIFVDAIKKLAESPDNLENLEFYLSVYFPEWLKKYANNPENMADEMKQFSEMKN